MNEITTYTNGNIDYRGTTYTRDELWAAYRERNDGGAGFAVGEKADSVTEAVAREGWKLAARLEDHADGPWGVRIG